MVEQKEPSGPFSAQSNDAPALKAAVVASLSNIFFCDQLRAERMRTTMGIRPAAATF